MTTTQLTKLKDAGFTLEQIIAIGEIFDPERPKPESPPQRPKTGAPWSEADARKAYEKGRKDAQDEQRRKEMGPMIHGDAEFKRRCEEFVEANRNTLFCRAMEIPRRAAGTLGIGIQTP